MAGEHIGGQFKVYKDQFMDIDTYDYVKPDPDPHWPDETHLTMSVSHGPGKNVFVTPETPEREKHFTELHSEATRDLHSSQTAGAPKLFGMASYPGESRVDYLQGTKAARVHVATMLGIAQNRNITQRGRSLTAATDLSEHSHRLVGHLAQKGVTDHPAEVSNSLGFVDSHAYDTYGPTPETISPGEVAQGRKTMRRVLKGGSPDPRGSAPLPLPTGPRKQGPVDPRQGTLF
jgi:hypothetical protein